MAISPAYAFQAPGVHGYGLDYANRMIAWGRQLRDVHVWNYPIFNGALRTCVEMASTREWRVSGSEQGVARMYESLHNSVCKNHNGIVEYGFDPFMKRTYIDSLVIGRMMYAWDDTLQYLDPAWMTFDLQEREWYEHFTQDRFPVQNVVINHPLPFGGDGCFVSPVSLVVPTAMLAWLIEEHDRASVDGRKIRDIYIVGDDDLAAKMVNTAEGVIAAWAGAKAHSNKVNIISYETADHAAGVKASDIIHRIGLANIPENFDREGFTLQYVNEIAAALGIAMRQFWNGNENGTNRSLEEIQEARQQVKGPAAHVRMMQRSINQCGYTKQFGRVRFGFVEEVDSQTQKTHAEVLKLYADALGVFVDKLQGSVLIESLVAWLQADGILPADLEIITTKQNDQKLLESDQSITANPKKNEVIQESDPKPNAISKSADLGYDEITMDSNGRIVERRVRVFSIEKMMEMKVRAELAEKAAKTMEEHTPKQFTDLLIESRAKNFEAFIKREDWSEENFEEVQRIKSMDVKMLSDEDYRKIRLLLDAA